jgi:radical SAM superfamily enzyme YgiQ (UPF0313 family)
MNKNKNRGKTKNLNEEMPTIEQIIGEISELLRELPPKDLAQIRLNIYPYLKSLTLKEFYGVSGEESKFIETLDKHIENLETKKIYFIDTLGAHAWANPLFQHYFYGQISRYIKRNYTNRWNLLFTDDLIKKKIEERFAKGYVDDVDVLPEYNTGENISLHMGRILSWSDDDMKSPIAQNLIDLHRIFNIPLFYIKREHLEVFVPKNVDFHVAVDAKDEILPQGCWIYYEKSSEDENSVIKERIPLEEYKEKYPKETRLRDPVSIFKQILESDRCRFAIEKRYELLGKKERKTRVFFINSPTRDTDGFRGAPTSLLYAISPLIEEIKSKEIGIASFTEVNIFDPTYRTETLFVGLRQRLRLVEPDVVGISSTSDAFHTSVEIAKKVKHYGEDNSKDIITILGGPHADEVDFDEPDNPNNPLNYPQFDFVVCGDGEHMLLKLMHLIVDFRSKWKGATYIQELKKYVSGNKGSLRNVKGISTLRFTLNGTSQKIRSSFKKMNLNNLSSLRYEYLKKDHLKDFDIFKDDEGNVEECVQIMSHRGCSGKCEFCSERILCKEVQHYYNEKKIPTVINEIENYARRFGVKAIFFDDSTFIEKEDYVIELCNALIESGLPKKIKWGCLNRFQVLRNEQIVKKLAQAKIAYTYLGLELYDDTALSLMRKPGHKQAIEEAIELLNKYGIKVGVSVLFGYPGVRLEMEEETIKFVGEMINQGKIHLVSLSLFNYHLMSSITSTDYEHKQKDLNYGNPGDTIISIQDKPPWNCFEEGGWFHAFEQRGINENYLSEILKWVDTYIEDKSVLVRKNQIEDAIRVVRQRETEKENKEPERPSLINIQPQDIAKTEKDWVKVCLVQLDFSVRHAPPPGEFACILEQEDEVERKVFSALEIAEQEKVNIICFPELSFAEEWVDRAKGQYRGMVIIGGSYYKNEFNTCPIIVEGDDYHIQKANPSPNLEKQIGGRGMKVGRESLVFQTRYGQFVVLVCRDYQRLIPTILDDSDEKIRDVDFVVVPQYNKSVSSFQKQADLDCQREPFPYILQVNAAKVQNKEIGGTCIIGTEHRDALERYKIEGYRPRDDIEYKLIEPRGEMMIIVELDIRRKGVPTPASGSKMNPIGCHIYKNREWVAHRMNTWL